MSVWLREAVGWLLLGAGVAAFVLCYLFLASRRLIECGPLVVIGIVVFRGGLHLLKVASAAKAMREATAPPPRATPARRLVANRSATRPGETRPSVVPGTRP